MKIEVLGTGCSKCKKFFELVQQAVKELNINADVEKVEDIKKIMSMGVMMTPALAIDGEIKVAGKLPNLEELKKWIQQK